MSPIDLARNVALRESVLWGKGYLPCKTGGNFVMGSLTSLAVHLPCSSYLQGSLNDVHGVPAEISEGAG